MGEPSAPNATILFIFPPTVDLNSVNYLGRLQGLCGYYAKDLRCAGCNRCIGRLKLVIRTKSVFACLCVSKSLIMRTQLRIKKVNKVMSLEQKSLTYNSALELLNYHNHHPLVFKPETHLLCSIQTLCRRRVGGNLIITCWC